MGATTPTAICASFSARRDLGVFVSPPARSARSTATDGGSPSRSTSSSHPIARASPGRTPTIRLTTMQACISEANRRRSFSLACRFSAAGACLMWHLPATIVAGCSLVTPHVGGRWLLVWLLTSLLDLATGYC